MAIAEVADLITFDVAVDSLLKQRAGSPYLPNAVTEGITKLIYGTVNLKRWAPVAQACAQDHGKALMIYVSQFPEDRFLIGYNMGEPPLPMWAFQVYPALPPANSRVREEPEALLSTMHDLSHIAIMMAVLERTRMGAR